MARRTMLRVAQLLLLCALATPAFPGEMSHPRQDHLLLGLPGGLLDTAPRVVSKTSLWIVLPGACATALLWDLSDERRYDAFLEKTSTREGVYNFGNAWGNGITGGVLAAGCWGAGRILGEPRLTGFGFDGAVALVGGAGAVWVLKTAVHRTRPDGGKYSFPSGHTCSAFSIVPAAWKYGGWKAGIPACLFGVATGLGRMEDSHHYLSDVVAGATLGLVVGTAACGTGGTWVPRVRVAKRGLGCSWEFHI